MNHPLDDLMQRALDGEVSAAETTRLEALLATDAAARSRYHELAGVVQALAMARMTDAPAGMREDILREIRHATASTRPREVPAARRPVFGKPTFTSWRRLAFSGVAVAFAVVAVWLGGRGLTWDRPGNDVSGTMSGRTKDAVVVGSGARAVRLEWAAESPGFAVRVRTGSSAVHVGLGTDTPGVRMGTSPGADAVLTGRVDESVPARTLFVVRGTAPDTQATIRVTLRFPDGETVVRVLTIDVVGLRPTRGHPPAKSTPTSETSSGH